METWILKVIVLFSLLTLMLIFAMLPIKVADYFIKKGEAGKTMVSLISCFGGGIFFGTFLLHMGPEVRQMHEDSWMKASGNTFPFPELCIGIGFFLVMYLEKTVMVINRPNANTMTITDEHEPEMDPEPIVMLSYSESHKTNGVVPTESRIAVDQRVYDKGKSKSGIRAVILILGLSFHNIFEGLGVGLQKTEVGVWNLFFAIAAHEPVIAFTVGMQLTKGYTSKGVVVGGIMYSIMTPIGIAIGTGVYNENDMQFDIINGILQGIAAGTFVYVTFMEILHDEITEDTPTSKILALTFGFVCMALLALIDDSSRVFNSTGVIDHMSTDNSTGVFDHMSTDNPTTQPISTSL